MTDMTLLLESLALATHGRGICAPNPAVGAVVVADGEVVGRGFHQGPGLAHAEVMAMREVPDSVLLGSTLYCTLEPCCHFGRTPPCTALIIEKKIARVVYGAVDPNVVVSGKGHQALAAAGVKVDFMPLELIQDFYKSYRLWTMKRLPFTTFKVAVSLNGKIAGPQSEAVNLTSDSTHEWTHRARKKSDAILTTVSTIRNDDPQFTVRLSRGEERKPVYVLDSRLTIPFTARIFSTASSLVLFHGEGAPGARVNELQGRGAKLIQVGRDHKGLDLKSVLSVIAERGAHDLWVEAGGKLLRSLLKDNVVDQLHLLVAPVFLSNDSYDLFGEGTELDLKARLPLVQWRQIGSVGLCTMERIAL